MKLEPLMSKTWRDQNAEAIKRGDFDISKIAFTDDIHIDKNMIDSKVFWTLMNRWLESEKLI